MSSGYRPAGLSKGTKVFTVSTAGGSYARENPGRQWLMVFCTAGAAVMEFGGLPSPGGGIPLPGPTAPLQMPDPPADEIFFQATGSIAATVVFVSY